MNGNGLLRCVFLLLLCLVVTPLAAAIVSEGDVTPDVSMWNGRNIVHAYVGQSADGSVRIDDGSMFQTGASVILGAEVGVTGIVTIADATSSWLNGPGSIYVGREGQGLLVVENGSTVQTAFLYASVDDLLGEGAINVTQGGILDHALTFDATHGLEQVLAFGSGGILHFNVAQSTLGVGYRQSGSLTIAEGMLVESQIGYLGFKSNSRGSAYIVGNGSQWNQASNLFVGWEGEGSLMIADGGRSTSNLAYLGYLAGSSGKATVTGTNSYWLVEKGLQIGADGQGHLTVTDGGVVETPLLYASPGDLEGNGTILVTQGAVLDANLLFDLQHGNQQELSFGSGGRLEISFSGGNLGVGFQSNGKLTVTDGRKISAKSGYLGLKAGAAGVARVSGLGSEWNMDNSLFVGFLGSGDLTVESGGKVANQFAYVAYEPDSYGEITVTGNGSQWLVSGALGIGYEAAARLTIESGGYVASNFTTLGNYSDSSGITLITGEDSLLETNSLSLYRGQLNLRSGGDLKSANALINSSFTLSLEAGSSNFILGAGAGQLTNHGTIRLLAGPTAPVNSENTPIAAGTWNGVGSFQALGGTWDRTNHIFTVSETIAGTSGSTVDVDLSQVQRVFFVDEASGLAMGASLLAKEGTPQPINFSAVKLLDPVIGVDVHGWNIDITGPGYTVGDPMYLSFSLDADLNRHQLALWHFNGTDWSPYEVDDLTVSGRYASFTTTELGGYALTLAGDYNGDGLVNGSDFLAWQRNPELGELADWKDIYGLSFDTQADATAVPEPGALVLCLLYVAAMSGSGWRDCNWA